MNKQRRKDLEDVIDLLDEAMGRLNEIKDEEQEAYDNLPWGLQDSERGETMQEAIDTMEEIESDIDTVRERVCELSGK